LSKIYLDIETTGLSAYNDHITLIGAYREGEVIQLVRGLNLDEKNLAELFSGTDQVVTFNGTSFDLPFIKKKFPDTELGTPRHKDLMYLGWKCGYKGGLKKIEKAVGIQRGDDLNGRDAIDLWYKYEDKKDLKALDTLLEYNRKDVVNLVELEKILEWKYEKQR